jgi:hypothetical protein
MACPPLNHAITVLARGFFLNLLEIELFEPTNDDAVPPC